MLSFPWFTPYCSVGHGPGATDTGLQATLLHFLLNKIQNQRLILLHFKGKGGIQEPAELVTALGLQVEVWHSSLPTILPLGRGRLHSPKCHCRVQALLPSGDRCPMDSASPLSAEEEQDSSQSKHSLLDAVGCACFQHHFSLSILSLQPNLSTARCRLPC